MYTCSFTGYRPSKLPFGNNKNCEEYQQLYSALENAIRLLIKNGVRYFQTGMAQGVDMICGEIVLELKKEFDIYLFCVTPYENQALEWDSESISAYKRIISAASGVICTGEDVYTKGCMMKRNRYLVDNADYILAVYDGQKGGTMYTVKYAKEKKKTILIINPKDYTKIELVHSEDEGVLYV